MFVWKRIYILVQHVFIFPEELETSDILFNGTGVADIWHWSSYILFNGTGW
jgi:hypothetical protein